MKVILVQRGISAPTHFVCGKSLKTYGNATFSAEHRGAVYEMSLAEYAEAAQDLIGNLNSGQQWVPLFVDAPVIPVAPVTAAPPVVEDSYPPTVDPNEPVAKTVDPDEERDTPQVTTMFIGSAAESAAAEDESIFPETPMGVAPTPAPAAEAPPPKSAAVVAEKPPVSAAELIQTLVSKEVGAVEARLMAAIERLAPAPPARKHRKQPTELQDLQTKARAIGLPVDGQSAADLRTALNTLQNAEAPA